MPTLSKVVFLDGVTYVNSRQSVMSPVLSCIRNLWDREYDSNTRPVSLTWLKGVCLLHKDCLLLK